MLNNLTISGFRTFRELHVDRLSRINLFVGTNNAGKTSILEATEIIAMGTVAALFRSTRRRGEWLVERVEGGASLREIDIAHLFHGHSLRIGSSFLIKGDGDIDRHVSCRIDKAEAEQEPLFEEEFSEDAVSEGILSVYFESHTESRAYALSSSGGINDRVRRLALYSPYDSVPMVNFLGTEDTEALRLSRLWDAVVLTPEEDSIAEALRIIEPRVERIAFLSEPRQTSVFLKLSASEQRLPLGSLGDGLKHLLSLTLHLSSARGGFLLVDEIDTGLHYTVMEDMWRLVIETARRLNVQVFTTTHSLDCIRALARVQMKNPSTSSDVMLHRLEKDATHTTVYGMDELVIAAQSQLEVR